MNAVGSLVVWLLPILIILISTFINAGVNSKIKDFIVFSALFLASFFAAIRFETGGDWDGYEKYYNAVNLNAGLIAGYLTNPLMLQFEPGYYLIAYGLKIITDSYSSLNAISVLFLFFSLLYCIRKISIKPYFVVCVFLGLPLVSLYYNQVRQSFAIAFVLFAMQAKNKKLFCIFSLLALLFQFSVVIFIIIVLISKYNKELANIIFRLGIYVMPFFALIIWFKIINSYELLKIFIPENLIFKIELYQEEDTSVGFLRLFSVSYFVLLVYYIHEKSKAIKNFYNLERVFIDASLLGALLIPYSLLLFPNSYAFFGRATVFSLIVLSFACAILNKKFSELGISVIPFYGLIILSIVYYVVTLYIYGDVYFPYKSIII